MRLRRKIYGIYSLVQNQQFWQNLGTSILLRRRNSSISQMFHRLTLVASFCQGPNALTGCSVAQKQLALVTNTVCSPVVSDLVLGMLFLCMWHLFTELAALP